MGGSMHPHHPPTPNTLRRPSERRFVFHRARREGQCMMALRPYPGREEEEGGFKRGGDKGEAGNGSRARERIPTRTDGWVGGCGL